MAYIARDKDTDLYVYTDKPIRDKRGLWTSNSEFAKLSDDADERLISKHITWEDEPVEI